MTDSTTDRDDVASEPHGSAGLRLRLWLSCLGGALVAAGGIWWVIGTQTGPGATVDLARVISWLGAIGGLAILVGAAFALWLDRGIVAQARGLTQAVATVQIARLRGLPGSSGWGELSQLTQQIQDLLSRHRHAERASEDLGLIRDQLASLREALDRWVESERWVEPRSDAGAAAPVIEALGRGLERLEAVREQNLEAARQIAADIELSLDAARESAEQAERGFVEATALLTTVRELQRLGQELAQATAAPPASGAGAPPGASEAARQGVEELVAGSSEIVEHLALGLRKVEEIAEQVPVLANRATLIALNSALGGRVVSESELAEETRRLVAEIHVAVDRAARLARELEVEVTAAAAQMRGVRERVALKLEALADAPPAPRGIDDSSRLLERVREMIQDATRKGERLSATGERASRSAEGLLRGLESQTREMSGLLARLAPPMPEPRSPEAPAARSTPTPTPDLRLLNPEDVVSDRPEERREPGASEEPR